MASYDPYESEGPKNLFSGIAYLFTQTLLKHFLLAGLLLVFLGWFTFFSLGVFTRHNQSFPMPDLLGMDLEQMQEVLDDQDLRYEVIDSVYNDAAPRGTVVEQQPRAGVHVKKDRRVFLVVNAYGVEKSKVPNVRDMPFRQAVSELVSRGLVVGRILYRPDIARELVLGLQLEGKPLAPDQYVPKGSEVDMVLGEGADPIPEEELSFLPYLLGKTKDEARAATRQQSLALGNLIYDDNIRTGLDSARAQVWRQSPIFTNFTPIPKGAGITVWLTIDPAKVLEAQSANEQPQVRQPEQDSTATPDGTAPEGFQFPEGGQP